MCWHDNDDTIGIEYEEEVIGVWIPVFDDHTDTIPAHGQEDILLYFDEWGTGHVTVTQNDIRETLTVPVEHPVLSVYPDALN